MEGMAPSVDRLCDALEAASARFVAMLRTGPDPSAPAIGVWTVGETAAHAAYSPTYFLDVARNEVAEPEVIDEVARNNAAYLAAEPERRPNVLADRSEAADAELIAFARTVVGDPIVEPFAGAKTPLSAVLATELTELLVHGYDIGRAARLPWPIPRDEATLALEGLLPLFPAIVDEDRARGVAVRCELRIRGGERVLLALARGSLTVELFARDTRTDCRMSVDPAAFLLLTFHRVGVVSSALRGRVLVWGRRPWRALSLQKAFKTV